MRVVEAHAPNRAAGADHLVLEREVADSTHPEAEVPSVHHVLSSEVSATPKGQRCRWPAPGW